MIGHHKLEGKLVNLNKPLAVLHRHDSQPQAEHEDSEDTAMEVDEPEGRLGKASEEKSWDMIAIVKRKMVFSKRPMPVVSQPDKKVSSAAPLSRIGSKA